MDIISARNPQMATDGAVELLVTFSGLGEIPFAARINDVEAHGRELYTRAMQGEFGAVTPYSAPVVPLDELAARKLAAVSNAKNTALDGGFWYDGILWDSDAKARLAYLELATQVQLDPTFSTPWKASTGTWRTMDAALFAALIPVYRAHVQACFAWQAAREQEVAAALALVTPILDEEGVETGEVDESAARAALAAVSEVMG